MVTKILDETGSATGARIVVFVCIGLMVEIEDRVVRSKVGEKPVC